MRWWGLETAAQPAHTIIAPLAARHQRQRKELWMDPDMKQAIIARAHRDRADAVAALLVAAARGLWTQVLKLRRAWAAGDRTRATLHRLDDRSPL
jgi:hypothetical protein